MSGLHWDRDGRDWPNRAHSHFVRTAGLTWHVQTFGEATAPALLLLHGTGAASHSWRDVAPALANHHRVIVPDLPGHGFTTGRPAKGMGLDAMARAVADLLGALGADPVLIAGHSAGAAIALALELDGLARPRMLVGVGAALLPIPGLAGLIFPPAAKLLLANPFAAHLFAAMARQPGEPARFLARSTGSRIDAAGEAAYRTLFGNARHCAGALAMMAAWDLPALRPRLARLSTPLLLVHGARDAAIPIAAAREAAGITKARLVEIAAAGHLVHEEQPLAIAGLITETLKEPA